MKRLTNTTDIPLSVAVWLAHDTYAHDPDPRVISATTLTNPIRSIVLCRQHKDLDQVGDIISNVASQSGTAYHDNIRRAWLSENLKETLLSLNYSETVINRMVINPPSGYEKKDDDIVIYVELRTKKACLDFVVSGELDFCGDGQLEDHKSTSVYALIFNSNAESYKIQGSIYRWLNPDKVIEDTVKINYIFTDWSASQARQSKDYPQKRIMSKLYPLMSVAETDAWIKAKLNSVQSLMGSPQDKLPLCTEEELWQSPTKYKYYKDPAKTARSTKNFDSASEAAERLDKDGHVGIVKEFKGQVKKCAFCKAREICDQAKDLVASGLLIL